MLTVVYGVTENDVQDEIKSISSQIQYESYESDNFLEAMTPTPSLILCYSSDTISSLEIAQTLRMNYPETVLFFIAREKKDFDKKRMIKNGFTQAYLLPWEKMDLLRSLKEETTFSLNPELRSYCPVKVVDLVAGTTIDFDLKIYLAKNNRLLPFATSGVPITEDKIEKLMTGEYNTLFVHKDDITKFHEYTVMVLKNNLKAGGSETERQERLNHSVRELVSDMFIEDSKENTFGKSQALLKEVKDVIHLMMMKGREDVGVKISSFMNQDKNFYAHFSNVACFSGLFAMILGFENPEDMALAGLLHDIGIINLPEGISQGEEESMTPQQLVAYQQHPQYSIDVIRVKRMVVPAEVTKAILQHHERIDGTGYPARLEGQRISKGGRLLAIANAFDNLTSLQPGRGKLSLREALLRMHEDNTRDPGRMALDIDMINQLKTVLLK